MLSIVEKRAGKTTLSGLICGFLTPESGSIELNGEDISPLSIKERGEKDRYRDAEPESDDLKTADL